MSVCSFLIELIYASFVEFYTTVLVKYFDHGIPSDRRLDGKVVVITGASAGIGKGASLLCAQRGAKVVMACRDLKKAELVSKEIKQKVSDAVIEVVKLELSSLDSVRQCAATLKEKYQVIDVLVNNAGLWVDLGQKTIDGHEMHFGVNYLSHFLLTLLLLPNLKRSTNGKVVSVASIGHRFASLDLNDFELKKNRYSRSIKVYANTKLYQILFTKALADRCPSIKTYVIHPGGVKNTEILRYQKSLLARLIEALLTKTPEEGAQTILHCLLDEKADQQSGLYYANSRVRWPSKDARSAELAAKVWKMSLDVVGEELKED